MSGIFVRAWDPLNLIADNIFVNVDFCNMAFALNPSCNYPEANLNGEVVIRNSRFYGTFGKQVEFKNDFI